MVGGGPAPGLNGVIAAATIEGINQGYEVIGFRDGFKHIAAGDTTQIKPLSIRDVKDIHLRADPEANPREYIPMPLELMDEIDRDGR